MLFLSFIFQVLQKKIHYDLLCVIFFNYKYIFYDAFPLKVANVSRGTLTFFVSIQSELKKTVNCCLNNLFMEKCAIKLISASQQIIKM